MSKNNDRPPIEHGKNAEFSKPKNWATGRPAVLSSLQHLYQEAGIGKGTKAMRKLNQADGFDCPSCAWPDPDDHRSAFEFCENGAKAVASEAMDRAIGKNFFEHFPVSELSKQSDYWHDQQGRLAEPMVLQEGSDHYQPITWDKAFKLIADKLKNLPSPDDGIFYTSGRASNEAAFMYQLFVRHFGTNNLPDCSNMCHESSGAALSTSVGVGKGTVTLEDFYESEVILCVGQNPGTNHPRMLAALEQAVENGAEVIAVNPMKEAGLLAFAHPQKITGMLGVKTQLASQYLQVRVNGDMALFRGIAKALLEIENAVDEEFLKEHCKGWEEYFDQINQTPWNAIEEVSGIKEKEIRELAQKISSKRQRLITCWAMGLTQHHNAVETIREVSNLHLMIGAIGRPGAGLCPVRGHSNVQGDRTMGIFEKMPESFHDKLDKVFDFKSPRKHGFDVVQSIIKMHDEPGKVFIALGGNFAQASPDTDYTAKALRNCDLTVHIATKLNRSHLIPGKTALILPCLGRSEIDRQNETPQFVTCENSMGVVQKSEGNLEPISTHLKSEVAIICGIAETVVKNTSTVNWIELSEDYDKIREKIEHTIDGFESFNDRVRVKHGFYLPNNAKKRVWDTVTKKANFSSGPLSAFGLLEEDRLILQTSRSHDQFNTTIYGLNDRYRGISNERRIIFLCPDDMVKRNLSPMSLVDIVSYWENKGAIEERKIEQFIAVPYDIPKGTAMAYFPEANALIPITSTAEESNTPTSKAVEIEVFASN